MSFDQYQEVGSTSTTFEINIIGNMVFNKVCLVG